MVLIKYGNDPILDKVSRASLATRERRKQSIGRSQTLPVRKNLSTYTKYEPNNYTTTFTDSSVILSTYCRITASPDVKRI